MKKFIKIIGWIVALVVVVIVAKIFGAYNAERANESESSVPVSPKESDIAVVVIRQPFPGMEESMLDAQALKELEEWNIETLKVKINQNVLDLGGDPNDLHLEVTARSGIIEAGGRRLGIIKLDATDPKIKTIKLVRVVGIKNQEMVWVSCVREGGADVPVWSGACGEKIKEIHGVEM